MKVAVLGTGSIGLASAALLGNGHEVTLWSPSGRGIEGLAEGRLSFAGAAAGEEPVQTSRELAGALAGAEVVIVAIPASGVQPILKECAALLRPGQAVFLMPMLSLAGLVLSQMLAARGVRCLIGGFGTTVMTARKSGPAEVRIHALRERLDVAGMPTGDTPQLIDLARQLFGDRFSAQSDLLAISLSQTNPVAHVPLALANLSRMERGEAWTQYDHMAGATSHMTVALDRERLAVARAFGLTVRSIEQHFHLSFGAPMVDFGDQCRWVHENLGSPTGPASLDTRYITEDVPYGLVFNARMGRMCGAATPVTDGCIALASAAYKRDFATGNALLNALDPELSGAPALLACLRSG
ncbi:MAG: NAD/NADP octopine/nopaline dehydrogenase family protein [Candidatus Parcubacteria bacterium]|nr:NAD/NADP octopine/nopaline dehydrogenase family protein [Burkholderiales bacterium]